MITPWQQPCSSTANYQLTKRDKERNTDTKSKSERDTERQNQRDKVRHMARETNGKHRETNLHIQRNHTRANPNKYTFVRTALQNSFYLLNKVRTKSKYSFIEPTLHKAFIYFGNLTSTASTPSLNPHYKPPFTSLLNLGTNTKYTFIEPTLHKNLWNSKTPKPLQVLYLPLLPLSAFMVISHMPIRIMSVCRAY